MARARVELRGSLTHVGGGRTFKKNAPQILTNASEIAYYKGQAGFSVTEMKDSPKAKAKAAPPPSDDSDESGSGDEEGYTDAELRAMTKADLVDLGKEMGLALSDADKKADLIAAILEHQG